MGIPTEYLRIYGVRNCGFGSTRVYFGSTVLYVTSIDLLGYSSLRDLILSCRFSAGLLIG